LAALLRLPRCLLFHLSVLPSLTFLGHHISRDAVWVFPPVGKRQWQRNKLVNAWFAQMSSAASSREVTWCGKHAQQGIQADGLRPPLNLGVGPMTRKYQVDCRQVQTYADFVEAFNKAFVETFERRWNGNLDAFNDYLSWPEDVPYQLIVLGTDQCARVLNYKANDRHEKELWSILQEILADNEEWAHVLFK
jgi:hypothetical protein